MLAADIGGTKSELALYEVTSENCTLIERKRFASKDFAGLDAVIESFFSAFNCSPKYASIGVAGPVSGRKAQLTNLPWYIDCQELEQKFGFDKALLVNDLTAVCHAIPILTDNELLELQQGSAKPGEMKGVIAPGTGLGQGFLLERDGIVFARGSEGGHVDFGPVDEEQTALLTWMQQKQQPVSYETLIAGPGIQYLYDFCKEYHTLPESPEVVAQMVDCKDRTPVIVTAAIASSPCRLCQKTIDLFLSILGSEAGNLALKLYAKGGVYIGGGIVPRLVGKVSFTSFLASFLNKGQMSGFMIDIPVKIILERDAALLGVARIGQLQNYS